MSHSQWKSNPSNNNFNPISSPASCLVDHFSRLNISLCVSGSRPATNLTAAQAYALRWDLSPYPATRQMPIIPREPIIEPLSPRVNIERNIFTPKFSSLKDKRSSKVVPLTDHRSWTVDESHSSKEEVVTKKEKFTVPETNSNSLPSSSFPNQLLSNRPKNTENSNSARNRLAASPCQSS